tara:strand:- start:7 stop:540 length:534 start_codon:yes stop_codon:yes gene_type:complete
MTALTPTIKLIPILEGFHLQYDSKYEKFRPILLKQLLPITELLLQLDNSPSIHDYFDEVCQRFIDANGYSVKGRNMLTSRMAKLKKVVSDSNPKRVMADLSPHDIPRIKRELPKALARQKRSKSQGENIQTYYQLFNRVMVEALNDSFISTPLKLSNPATKKADNTRPFSTCVFRRT